VRCHLHTITRRAEDRLTFDLQREVAARMQFADRPGKSAVERFMQYFFLQAKRVGHLTGVFLAQLDDQFAQEAAARPAGGVPRAARACSRAIRCSAARINVPGDDWFAEDPVRLIEIFVLADSERAGNPPRGDAPGVARCPADRSPMRHDPRANALFLDLLTSRNDPETVLRWLNEAGVFGRFVPDFGRVNAQMQFDMYHHYTVDEHTIRAIGLLRGSRRAR
jgi:[protein-PII] uridylyltransferase